MGLRTKGSPVQFPVRSHAWVTGQVPSRGYSRGNHILIFPFLSCLLSFPLSKRYDNWLIQLSYITTKLNSSLIFDIYQSIGSSFRLRIIKLSRSIRKDKTMKLIFLTSIYLKIKSGRICVLNSSWACKSFGSC